MVKASKEEIAVEIEKLETFDIVALQKKWIELYGVPTPKKVRKDFLKRAIAYRLQENAFGGLKPATIRQLERMAKELSSGLSPTITPAPALHPGIRLMREWNGVMQRVDVVEDGFRWKDQHFTSLSAIAMAITGTRWSGPRFFGLQDKERQTGGRP